MDTIGNPCVRARATASSPDSISRLSDVTNSQMTAPRQHSAGLREKRKHMTRSVQVGRNGGAVGQRPERCGPVTGAYSRRRRLRCIDADQECRTEHLGVGLRHVGQFEPRAGVRVDRSTDEPGCVLQKERDRFDARVLRRHHEIGLVFAVGIVDDDNYPTVADGGHSLRDRVECHDCLSTWASNARPSSPVHPRVCA